MASRSAGKKSERSRAQAKALEDAAVDPAVTRLQGTLEENLDFFLNNIGGMVRDLNAKLDASRKACEAAHGQMGVSLATALAEGAATPAAPGSPVPASSPAHGAAAPGGQLDADTEAAAAAIAAKVHEADERRNRAQQALTEAAAAAAGSPKKAADANGDAAAPAAAKAAAEEPATIAITYPDNALLLEQLLALKKEAYALGTTFDGIHDWVALNVPDFKDDDNDGVEVMGAVIQQISGLQDAVKDAYASELKYLEDRSELEKALLKVPDSDTVRRQLEVLDLDAWDDVERGWRVMIRVSLILFSMLAKNMKALREPRKARGHNLFM